MSARLWCCEGPDHARRQEEQWRNSSRSSFPRTESSGNSPWVSSGGWGEVGGAPCLQVRSLSRWHQGQQFLPQDFLLEPVGLWGCDCIHWGTSPAPRSYGVSQWNKLIHRGNREGTVLVACQALGPFCLWSSISLSFTQLPVQLWHSVSRSPFSLMVLWTGSLLHVPPNPITRFLGFQCWESPTRAQQCFKRYSSR